MKYLIPLLSVLGFLVLSPASARAQYGYGDPGYGYYGDYWGYYGYHSSTPQEGYGRGLADIIRSQGIYNRLSAEARVNEEEARRRHIENYKEGVETYFETRELNRQYRAAEHAERRAGVQQRLENRTPDEPRRLSPSELNPTTGDIHWPRLLQKDIYSSHRETLERMFAQWAHRGRQFDYADYERVLVTGDEMLERLKDQIRNSRPSDYLAAKRFVRALMNEARFPTS